MSVTAIQSVQGSIPYSSTVIDIVKKIAFVCLKEFTVSLTLGLTVACFVPTPAGITWMVGAAVVQLGVSAFFHSLGVFAATNRSEKLLSVCEWVTGANFALLTGLNTQFLIHETGHALAALSIYKKPRPQIYVRPFIGGLTDYCKTSLGLFGKKMGPVAATCFVLISGPVATLLISSAILTIGLGIKEKYPHFSKYLIAWGVLDFLNHAHYAYSALSTDSFNLAHDFVHLSIFGLDPVVATIAILAIPVILYTAQTAKKRAVQPNGP